MKQRVQIAKNVRNEGSFSPPFLTAQGNLNHVVFSSSHVIFSSSHVVLSSSHVVFSSSHAVFSPAFASLLKVYIHAAYVNGFRTRHILKPYMRGTY